MTVQILETIRFGEEQGSAGDNFDEWAQHSMVHRLRRLEPRFRAEASFWHLDQAVVTEQRMSAFAGERSPEHLASAPTNQVTLVALPSARMRYQEDGAWEIAEPGDLVLLDTNRCYAFEVEAGHSITVSIARGELEDDLGPLAESGRLRRTPETAMLAEFIEMMVRRLPTTATTSAAPLMAILRRLTVLALNRGLGPSDPRAQTARSAAINYVEAQPFGRLNVATMSAALGMTRATLYRLFRADGGVLAFDRRRRLRLLHRSLCEDTSMGLPLSEMGVRYGFLDASSLARQFKAEFGVSMSKVRLHLPPCSTSGGSIARYRDAKGRFT